MSHSLLEDQARTNHLIQDLAGVRLEADSQLDRMAPALGVLARSALQGNVDTSRASVRIRTGNSARSRHLVELARDVLDLGKIDRLDGRQLLLGVVEAPLDVVDEDDAGRLLEEAPLGRAEADGAGPPDGHNIALLDIGVHDLIVAGGQDIGEVQAVFIGDFGREDEEADIAVRDARVFRLAACKTACD
jgi:hypothetical protein